MFKFRWRSGSTSGYRVVFRIRHYWEIRKVVNGHKSAAHPDSPDGGTGKTCLGGGMHCPMLLVCNVLIHEQLECGPMPNVMATQPYIGGALCQSSVIPFLVPRHKFWLTVAARVPCSNAGSIGERKSWKQSEFCSWWQNSVIWKGPQKCIYIVYQPGRRPNSLQNFVDLR